MADKLDFKKEYKDLYMPGRKPVEILVPRMNFIQVDGVGDPNGTNYQDAMSALYALSFTIKMSKMSDQQPQGYVEYVVPPLEGLWDVDPANLSISRDEWTWTSMIRQPDFVTQDVYEWALAEAQRKKPEINFDKARYAQWEEGLCLQAMHIGPYSTEPETVAQLHAYMEENGLAPDFSEERRHHEIYLGDPRRIAPEKRRTVLRLPVRRS